MNQTPLFFDRNTYGDIPERRGIYGFFFNLDSLKRVAKHGGNSDSKVRKAFEKVHRAHTMSEPDRISINLYGKSKNNFLDLQPSHRLDIPIDLSESTRLEELAHILPKMTLLTPPIYIGLTGRQTFRQRFRQHKDKYERFKEENWNGESGETFSKGGGFPAKLAKRNLEFRDLLFACVPLEESEMEHIQDIEKIVQAITNPTLSESS